MAIRDFFHKGIPKVKSAETLESAFDLTGIEIESSEHASERSVEKTRFVPDIDYSSASNFAHYGSAEEYYRQSFKRVYQQFPYDGTRAEVTKFDNESTFLDRYIFDKIYPRTTGYAVFSPSEWGTLSSPGTALTGGYGLSDSLEYISVKGGPHTSSGGMIGEDLRSAFGEPKYRTNPSANKYDTDIYSTEGITASGRLGTRESNLRMDLSKGASTEFWIRKGDWITSKTEKEVIFDLWNGEASSSAGYGRVLITLTGSTDGQDPFRVHLASGSSVWDMAFGGSTTTTSSLTNTWNHVGFTFLSSSDDAQLQTKFYLNGDLQESQTTTGKVFGEVTGSLIGFVGALQTSPSGNAFHGTSMAGYGKLSGSIDEFRYWKTKRTSKDIGRNWFTHVGGGTNDHIANTELGVYFKFNEGITTNTSTDSVVLDYSGRISNGNWVGYSSTSRNTGSAIVSASAATTEYPDPIIYSSHPDVTSLMDSYIASGSIYDEQNTSLLYHHFPSFMLEEEEERGDQKHLRNLTQIVGSYFDEMHLQIESLVKLSPMGYVSSSAKPLSMASDLLKSKGFITPEIFDSANILEWLSNRDEDRNFELELEDVKNQIYQNIYNNLININKSKGTEKAFRNLIRCYGVDEDLVKINLYSNNATHLLKDNYRTKAAKKKYADFNALDRFGASVYQQSSSTNSNTTDVTYISGSDMHLANTAEIEVVFPRKVSTGEGNQNYFPTSFVSSSIFGCHTAVTACNNFTWPAAASDFGFQVYAVRPKLESKDAYFVIKDRAGNISLTSDVYEDVYDNQKWNFSVRLKNERHPIGDSVTGSTIQSSSLEFRGINVFSDVVRNDFSLTAALTSSYLTSNRRYYLGSERTNFTGSSVVSSDIRATSLRHWASYVDDSALLAHAKDPENHGSQNPARSTYLTTTLDGTNVPQAETLALHWGFSAVTGSDAAGTFIVDDLSSGSVSLRTRYPGDFGAIVGNQYTGAGIGFPANSTDLVMSDYISSARQRLPESLGGLDMINIVTDSESALPRDERPEDYYFTFEKNMYQTISEEMLNMFGTIVEFNNLIGSPVHKYRHEYKGLSKLRNLFFERIENTPDIDKYIDYYKWIDSSLSQMLQQLIPASADTSEGILNVIESHILERNKYRHKIKMVEDVDSVVSSAGRTLPEGNIRGHEEMNYPWARGHAPETQIISAATATITVTNAGECTTNNQISLVTTGGDTVTITGHADTNAMADTIGGSTNGTFAASNTLSAADAASATITVTNAGECTTNNQISVITTAGDTVTITGHADTNAMSDTTGASTNGTFAAGNTLSSTNAQATATITVTDAGQMTTNNQISLVTTAGATVTITGHADTNAMADTTGASTNGTFAANNTLSGGATNNNTQAAAIAATINLHDDFTASAASAVVTITQVTGGTAGNTSITTAKNGGDGDPEDSVTIVNFSGGTNPQTAQAAAIATTLNLHDDLTATSSVNVVTITQGTAGLGGNTNITLTDNGGDGDISAAMTVVNFSGGTNNNITQATAIASTINLHDDFTATNSGTEVVTITQNTHGTAGNTSITLTDNGGDGDISAAMTVVNFTGGKGSPAPENENCFWWKERAERDGLVITSGDSNVDSRRNTLRDIQVHHISASAPHFVTDAGTAYESSIYAARALPKIHHISSELQKAIQSRKISFVNHKKTYYKGAISFDSTAGLDITDIQSEKDCTDVVDIPSELKKTKKHFTTSGEYDERHAPFSMYSSSVDSGYASTLASDFMSGVDITNNHDDDIMTTNEIPMQGPFTERFVGGSPHRHADINHYDPSKAGTNNLDSYLDRIEGYDLDFSTGKITVRHQEVNQPRSSYYRDGTAKRPVNIKNLKQVTGSTTSTVSGIIQSPIGNFSKVYEVVRASDRATNNSSFVKAEGFGSSSAVSSHVSSLNDHATPIRPRAGHIIVEKFSSPGDAASSIVDLESGQFSPYNDLNTRNWGIRGPLRDLLTEHSERFGIRSGSSEIEASYDANASFHKVNRNPIKRIENIADVPSLPATATITVTDAGQCTTNNQISVITTAGDTVTITGHADTNAMADTAGASTNGTFAAGNTLSGGSTNNNTQAAAIAATLNLHEDLIAVAVAAVVTITQNTNGTAGNTNITLTDNGGDGDISTAMTVVNFSGGVDTDHPSAEFVVHDNYYVQHPIPRSDLQYSWISSSYLSSYEYGHAARDGLYSGSSEGIVPAILFASASNDTVSGIKVDHLGLNTLIVEPVSSSVARIGYPLGTSVVSLKNTEFGTIDTPAVLNSVLLHRGGIYGFSSWKQISNSYNPIVRTWKKENTFAFNASPGDTRIIRKPNHEMVQDRFGDLQSYTEPPITSRNFPLRYVLDIKTRQGTVMSEIKSAYGNEVEHFTNSSLNTALYMPIKDGIAYGKMKSLYLYGALGSDLSPVTGFRSLTYKQGVYPRAQNSFLLKTRERPDYANNFWRSSQTDRDALGNSKFSEHSALAGNYSSWNMDADIAFATMLPSGQASATITVADGDAANGMTEKQHITLTSTDGTAKRYVLTNAASDGSTATGTVLSDTANTDTGAGTAGADEDGGIAVSLNLSSGTQNGYLVQLKAAIEHANGHNGKITVSAVPGQANGAQLITLTQAIVGTAGNVTITENVANTTVAGFTEGNDFTAGILQNNLTHFHNGIKTNITSSILFHRKHSVAATASVRGRTDPLAATVTHTLPTTLPLGDIIIGGGNALWEVGDQAGYYDIDGTFVSAPSYPWSDSYDDYAEELRVHNKDYSIIPEFRISEHIESYIENRDGDFLSPNSSFLSIEGASSDNPKNSSESDFYKVYSNSDFMNKYCVIREDHRGFVDPVEIKLTCKVLKKFVPYNGFYPSELMGELSTRFSSSYLDNVKFTGSDANLAKSQVRSRSFIAPFFAPGIWNNMVKSGIAVDYPIYTASYVVHNPIYSSNAAHKTDYYLLSTSSAGNTDGFDLRVPFEAIINPEDYIGNTTMVDMDPHPSASLICTASWDGNGDNLYKMKAHNALASMIEFFLPGNNNKGELATLVSSEEKEWKPFKSGSVYGMRVKLRKSYNQSRQERQIATRNYPIPQDSKADLVDGLTSNITICSRPSSFGPPMGGRVGTFAQTATSELHGASFYRILDSLRGVNPGWTPGYTDGEAWSDILYTHDTNTQPSLEYIQSKATIVNWRFDEHDLSGSNGGSNRHPYGFGNVNNYAMQLPASINVLGKKLMPSVESDSGGNTISVTYDSTQNQNVWAIQPKMEVPIVNVNRASVTIPTYASESVPRSVWSQFGTIPTGSEGIYLDVGDIDASWLKNRVPIYATQETTRDSDLIDAGDFRSYHTTYNAGDVKSLSDHVGFKRKTEKLGQISKSRIVKEAVVAVPFLERDGKREFFEIAKKDIKISLENLAKGVEDSSVDSMVSKMKEYIFPPKFDFVKYRDKITPFAMYVFEFQHEFDQDDLSYIWQGIQPLSSKTVQMSESSIKHKLLAKELMGKAIEETAEPLQPELRWMVFKVKQRSAANYYDKVVANQALTPGLTNDIPVGRTTVSETDVPEYSYNWPYDYFSMIESVKIDSEVRFAATTSNQKVRHPDDSVIIQDVGGQPAAYEDPGSPTTDKEKPQKDQSGGKPNTINEGGDDGGDNTIDIQDDIDVPGNNTSSQANNGNARPDKERKKGRGSQSGNNNNNAPSGDYT